MDPHKRVPIRWLAPETLRTAIYSQKTDCFAYGILCWEIFSNGAEPYPGMTVAEVNIKVRKEGYRMKMPQDCSIEFSTIITKHIWTETSNDRWSMKQIVKALEQLTHMRQPVKFTNFIIIFYRILGINLREERKAFIIDTLILMHIQYIINKNNKDI